MPERPDFQVRGEWDSEPDREEFDRAELPCLVLRGPVGSLCGYVGVPPAHPSSNVKYQDVQVDVHYGLTYGDEGDGEMRRGGFYWFGFDCGHLGDYIPGIAGGSLFAESPGNYRNWAYVKREVERLAEQLAAMMPAPTYSEWRQNQERGDD